MAELNTDVRYIKGVGEARAKAMARLGLTTLRDLVMYFPRTYEDRSTEKTIGELMVGESVCVRATVASTPRVAHIRRGMDLVKLRVVDGRDSMDVTYFNQSYVKDALRLGEEYVFYGRVGGRIGMPEMVNPVFEPASRAGETTGRLVPIYGLTSGITQNMLRKAVRQGLTECGDLVPDPLPESVRREYRLCQSRFAYENVHFPQDSESLELARRRLIFEELFVLSCALDMFRRERTVREGMHFKPIDPEKFYKTLPFTPTNAQKRAVREAIADMAGGEPMSRLLQGDVGSGKTLVAAACCLNAVKNGCQAAFMAPTEILAEQHQETLKTMLGPLGVNVVLLTGGMTAPKRREALGKIKSGEANVVVGTHALISQAVEYDRLGLVVADEQHRFGVAQRAALSEKGESPHVLVMSATPIPRTLALIIYGDLDVSLLDELPPGRQKVDTFAVDESFRTRINNFIRKIVGQGNQVYIICPAVEETEEQPDGLKAVTAYAKELSENVFPDLSVGLVHGKLKAREKNAVMSAFSSGEINILVATTVVEVGVDVPNAVLMVVENADRFGLSQLHQLRGRVGRGKDKSYCVLFEGSGGDRAMERLKVMCATNDGFKIAEEDLRQRGPGDFFGSRQHGLPEMKIAGLATDMNVLRDAQDAARAIMAADPGLTQPTNAALRESITILIEKNALTLN